MFIDDSGGWGASWIDQLRRLGREPTPVGFSSRAEDPRYDNRRTEMYFRCAEWIKGGGAIPDIPELIAGMTQTTYSFRGDRLLLEPKDQVKQRLGYSPDDADALALTFASTQLPNRRLIGDRFVPPDHLVFTQYDPLDPDWKEKAKRMGAKFYC